MAVKVTDIGHSAEEHASFVTEANRLAALRHANIVELYGVSLRAGAGETRGKLILEYCEGGLVGGAKRRALRSGRVRCPHVTGNVQRRSARAAARAHQGASPFA